MAVSELPAMADRRAHFLDALPARHPCRYLTLATTQENPYPRPDSEGSKTAIPFVTDSKKSCRQARCSTLSRCGDGSTPSMRSSA